MGEPSAPAFSGHVEVMVDQPGAFVPAEAPKVDFKDYTPQQVSDQETY